MVYNSGMENEKILNAIKKQFLEEYYTAKELQYSNKAGIYLSPFEYKQFIEYKENIASFDNLFRYCL